MLVSEMCVAAPPTPYRRVPLLGPLSSQKGYPSDLLSRLDFSNFLTSWQSLSNLDNLLLEHFNPADRAITHTIRADQLASTSNS